MTYRALPYAYAIEEGKSGLAALGGVPIYLELAAATGLLKAIDRHLHIRTGEQGWSDRQIIVALLLLNLAGGDSVNDIEVNGKQQETGRSGKRFVLYRTK